MCFCQENLYKINIVIKIFPIIEANIIVDIVNVVGLSPPPLSPFSVSNKWAKLGHAPPNKHHQFIIFESVQFKCSLLPCESCCALTKR